QTPRSKAAHAQTGQIDAIRIYVELLFDALKQPEQALVVPLVIFRAKWGNNDEREIFSSFHKTHRSMNGYALDIRAAFPCFLQKDILGRRGTQPSESVDYMIFSLGKSWESTKPTGSCFALTTIKSSMFRSLKIFKASTASASSRMQIGLRVITHFNVCASKL